MDTYTPGSDNKKSGIGKGSIIAISVACAIVILVAAILVLT